MLESDSGYSLCSLHTIEESLVGGTIGDRERAATDSEKTTVSTIPLLVQHGVVQLVGDVDIGKEKSELMK